MINCKQEFWDLKDGKADQCGINHFEGLASALQAAGTSLSCIGLPDTLRSSGLTLSAVDFIRPSSGHYEISNISDLLKGVSDSWNVELAKTANPKSNDDIAVTETSESPKIEKKKE